MVADSDMPFDNLCRVLIPQLKKSVPNSPGSTRRQTLISAAAAMFAAVKRLDINREHVSRLSQRSSGHSDGSTTARRAVNMDGAEVRLEAT